MEKDLNKYEFTIEEDIKWTRLDVVISLVIEEASRSHLQKLIDIGMVQVNGESGTLKKYKVKAGDVFRVSVT